MAIISPFIGLRYNTKKIDNLSLVTTPPYDIISPEAQQEYYDLHENNMIRIELGKDFEDDNENHNKYTRAKDFLDSWISNNILVYENAPAIYIYAQDFPVSDWEIKTRRGIICLVKLADFSEGIVLPHEATLSKPKSDRFNLINSTHTNTSQIFSLYNDDNQISSILESFVQNNQPEFEFTSNENISERVWVIKDTNIIKDICSLFADKQLFIADGHHRYETALNFRNKLACENPAHTDSAPYNYVMMTLVDMNDPGLVIFPTHRVLTGLSHFDSEDFLKYAQKYFDIDKIEFNRSYGSEYIPEQVRLSLAQKSEFGKSFGYFDNTGSWYYLLTLKSMDFIDSLLAEKSPAYRSLDVSILHSIILDEYFKIDINNLERQSNVIYTRDISQAINWVQSSSYQCAFFLNPTKIEQIKEVSLAHEKMPQKSTYFYPKLTTGLVLYKF